MGLQFAFLRLRAASPRGHLERFAFGSAKVWARPIGIGTAHRLSIIVQHSAFILPPSAFILHPSAFPPSPPMIPIMRPQALLAFLLLCMTCASSALAFGAAPAPRISAALNYQSLPPGQQAAIAIVIDTPPGYHIQSHNPIDPNFIALEVSLKPNPALKTFAPIYPTPEIKQYPALGQLSMYEGRAIIYIPIQVKPMRPGDR